MDIISGIKSSFRNGGTLVKLIYINVAVFVIAWILDAFTEGIVEYFMLPADGMWLISQPWSLISYMFLHTEFMHILFNMLWLFWFGQMFVSFVGQKQLLNVYLVGGLAGGLLYVLMYNVIPALSAANSLALGASASVMAIVLATAVYRPNVKMYLMFFGEVKIFHIALVALALDALFLFSGQNVGGHIAHLGGAGLGWLYAERLKKGTEMLKGFERFMDSVFSLFSGNFSSAQAKRKRSKMTINYGRKTAGSRPQPKSAETSEIDYNARKREHQERIDKILEKISKSGYDSLSKEEKEILFKEGRK